MTSEELTPMESLFEKIRDIDYTPVREEVPAAEQSQLDAYRKALSHFFLRGVKTPGSPDAGMWPVLVAPYLQGSNADLNYPAFYDLKKREVQSLLSILHEEFNNTFIDNEAEALETLLSEIASIARENSDPDYASQVRLSLDKLHQKYAKSEDIDLPGEHIDKFQNQLLKREGIVIGYSELTPLHLLNLQVQERVKKSQAFLDIIKKRTSGLRDILLLQKGDKPDHETDSHFGFASSLLSFNKIEQIAVPHSSSKLPEGRLHRVRYCLKTLEDAQKTYRDFGCFVFTSDTLARQLPLQQVLESTRVETVVDSPCVVAREFANQELQNFVQIMAAMKLADLELEQKYDEELHSLYFEHFDLSYLGESDLAFLRPIIVVEEAGNISQRPGDFLALISDGAPVKVLAINRLEDMSAGETGSLAQTGSELVALAIFRRNAYVFQGAPDTPALLNDAFRKGLATPVPALWNILAAGPGNWNYNQSLALLTAAIESRDFARVEFDVSSGSYFGSHFNINGNSQPEKDFPVYSLNIRTSEGETPEYFAFTSADYLAAFPGMREKLEILPGNIDHEDLVPLSDYLVAAPETMAGKLPFIWLVDDKSVLKKAVVPIAWLHHCRARMEYWQFLQELGGTKSYHTQRAVDSLRADLEADKEAALEALSAKLQAEFENTRQDDLGKAISRMLYGLLDPEQAKASQQQIIATASFDNQSNGSKPVEAPVSAETEEASEPAKATVSSDAWVDSDQCTSCSDCIDALPGVFKYNEDKQAIVHNPKGGTYAKIVSIAEKCPARCIHPGLPHNPDEKGLEKLLKRAEKFN